jgi:hypothetical protein
MHARTRLAPTLGFALLALLGSCTATRCATFDDLPEAGAWTPGDVVSSDGVELPVGTFRASLNATPATGSVVVLDATSSSGLQRGIELRVASIAVPLDDGVDHVRLRALHLGGRASFPVNAFVFPWDGSPQISGTFVGPGGSVFVDSRQYAAPSGQPHNWSAHVILAGAMQSLAIGGEELWIDELCIVDDDCTG